MIKSLGTTLMQVSVIEVFKALIEESERRYSNDYQPIPKDMDNEHEAFNRGMGDFVVLMVGAAIIARSDETLQV